LSPDLNIYRRPNVYNCHTAVVSIPPQDASNLTPRNLTVTNPQPCDSSNWTSLFVAAPTGGPLVLFVDPPVIYNGITIGVLVYTAGLNTTAQSVVAVNSATGTNYYNLTIQPSSNYNQIPVLIPAGTLPAGTYDIIVNSPYAIGGIPLPGRSFIFAVDICSITTKFLCRMSERS
jgi:hypothetical protein